MQTWTAARKGVRFCLQRGEAYRQEALMAEQTVARNRGEGTAYWMLGGLYELKASSAETGGTMSIFEMTIPAGSGPPPHTHAGGEAVYVMEGRIRYHIGDDVIEGGPGSFFYIPEGTWENFEPTEQVRLLVIYTPGGTEEFFAEAGEPAGSHELPPPPDGPPDLEKLIAAAERHGMQIRAPQEA
jgi:quercetin dioxygenase-like cupin family protein